MADNLPPKGGSKRQRIFDLMKTTKDVYIPSLSNTISQLANEATSKAIRYTEDPEYANTRDLKGANIVLYPHFTRFDGDNYFTQVHGWVYSTEGSQRKKKLVMTLARQLAKSNNNASSDMTAGQLDEQLNSIQEGSSTSETSSFVSTDQDSADISFNPPRRTATGSSNGSVNSSFTSTRSETDEVLKERIAAFVNRSLGNLELTVGVGGAKRDELKVLNIFTDTNGNFNIDVETDFKPTYTQVAVTLDEKIFVFNDTIFPGKSDYAIISDIDDTIKKTGVCLDKRSIFRNTFADHMSNWEIPGAAENYRYFEQEHGLSFFYVSNSPYQLFTNLSKFFELFQFPKGSMYLKKYTGNILNSFLEPSHTRKKAPLERILSHFGDKKFFLIGDTSEQDLEAYVDTARLHPDKIQGIYLRVAEGSMSTETLKLLLDILNKKSISLETTSDEFRAMYNEFNDADQPLIDLDSDLQNANLSDSQLNEIAERSKIESERILNDKSDLEKGAEGEFFSNNDRKPPVPPKPRSLSPSHQKPPPRIPKKPDFLKAQALSNPASSNTPPQPISRPGSSDTAPPLPRRPIPTPPRPRERTPLTVNSPTTINSNRSIGFDEEANEEWISRILTSLIVLRKVGDINLKLFVNFDEIHNDILNKITK